MIQSFHLHKHCAWTLKNTLLQNFVNVNFKWGNLELREGGSPHSEKRNYLQSKILKPFYRSSFCLHNNNNYNNNNYNNCNNASEARSIARMTQPIISCSLIYHLRNLFVYPLPLSFSASVFLGSYLCLALFIIMSAEFELWPVLTTHNCESSEFLEPHFNLKQRTLRLGVTIVSLKPFLRKTRVRFLAG